MKRVMSQQTIAASSGIASDSAFNAVTPPLYLSSTFEFDGFMEPGPYDYSRGANPTRNLLAETLARLEQGAGGIVVASGMAALDLVIAQCAPTDLIVAPHDCYAGTRRLLLARSAKSSFSVLFVNQSDKAAMADALAQKPALILVETPSNPLMRLTDIAWVAECARQVGAKLAVDNTFLSPVLQTPLVLGADYVIHSTTKYLNGHSDIVGGVVIAKSPADVERLSEWANITGVSGAAFDAFLTLRGVRTLFPRVHAQQKTAASIASFLTEQLRVRAVHYPGLPGHPDHTLAKQQQAGFGAMLSFDLDGTVDDVGMFLRALGIFTLAESLGGTESLIAHPASMTHVSMDPVSRLEVGITPTLLRLSVGLEDEQDLLKALEDAFTAL